MRPRRLLSMPSRCGGRVTDRGGTAGPSPMGLPSRSATIPLAHVRPFLGFLATFGREPIDCLAELFVCYRKIQLLQTISMPEPLSAGQISCFVLEHQGRSSTVSRLLAIHSNSKSAAKRKSWSIRHRHFRAWPTHGCLVFGLNQTFQGRNQFGSGSRFCDVPFDSHQTGT